MIARRFSMLLAFSVLIQTVLTHNSNINSNVPEVLEEDQMLLTHPLLSIKEISYLKNVINAYRSLEQQFGTDLPAALEHPEKRNANIINTLLGFPRRMLMAGR